MRCKLLLFLLCSASLFAQIQGYSVPATGGVGLQVNIGPGSASVNGVVVNWLGGYLMMPPQSTNYVYLDAGANLVSNASGFPASSIPIAKVTTNRTDVTAVSDLRTTYNLTPAGGTTGVTAPLTLPPPAYPFISFSPDPWGVYMSPSGGDQLSDVNGQLMWNPFGVGFLPQQVFTVRSYGTPLDGQVEAWNIANGDFELQTGKPAIDWLDKGVTSTGEQSANITAAWNAVGSKNAGWIHSNPVGNFQFSTTVTPNSFGGYAMEGLGGAGQFGSGANFLWTGGANYALNLDRQRDAIIGRFLINLNAVVGASGINVTQLTATSGQIASHNLFHDIQINGLNGTGSIGFNIVGAAGDGGQNNEGHTLWRVGAAANSTYNTGSICMNLNSSSNARDIGYYEGEHIGCGIGYSLAGGSWHVFGGLTQNHNVALSIITGAQGGTYAFVHDEASKQGILSTGSNQYSYLFLGNTYETDTVDLTKPYWDMTNLSTAVSIANIMKTNAAVTKMVAPPVAGTLISIGDQMPNTTVANLPKLQNFARSITIGTTTPYTSGATAGVAGGTLGGATIFTGTNNNFSGDDGTYGPVNALWLGTSNAGSVATTQWYSSPGFVLSALYNDGAGASHTVPFRYKVLLTDATGTSAATWKLMLPTDPITGTNYGGVLNFDFATNGNNFKVALLQTTAVTFSTLPACAGGTEGTTRAVTDSTVNTWGTTITGGGANHVMAYCDGTNWTVMAK